MRTKHTGGGAKKVQVTQTNGTPVKSPPVAEMRSPQQPQLTEADKTKLKNWLESNDRPFSISTHPVSKKRKRGKEPQVQSDLFEDRLTVQYEVKPANNWESLRRYKKFTVGQESIAVGECIYVKHDDGTGEEQIDLDSQWKAKVLEVRALDPEHVYIRVAWLNRPEDMDKGRKNWHGKNELIPTNQIDIIDAMSVNGRLEVYHWDESDDDSPMPGTEEYFWRQTYDVVNANGVSELRELCVDQEPQNPDEMILQCANQQCRKWMHLKCIAEDAVTRASGESGDTAKSSGKKKGKAKAKAKSQETSPTPPAVAAALNAAADLKAEVIIKGLPDKPEDTPADETRIEITYPDGEQRTEDVHCLFCNTAIE